MDNHIEYENCFYCGSPIRNKVFSKSELGHEFQLPWCSDICQEDDIASAQVIEQVLYDNIKYNQEGGEISHTLNEIKNTIQDKIKYEDFKPKGSDANHHEPANPNSNILKYVNTIYSSIGILFIIIIVVSIFKSNSSSTNLKIFGRLFVTAIIPLIREIWVDMKK
jgi:hypothetical protein